MRQVFRENSSYYLVGYERAAPAADGRFHKIDIRANRPDVTVRTRRGYYAPRAESAAAADADAQAGPPDLEAALADILPKADVPIEVAVAPVAAAGEKQVALALALGVRPPALEGGSGPLERIDVLAGAYDPQEDPAGERRVQVPVASGSDPDAPIEIPVRLDVKPGRYQRRLAVQQRRQVLAGSFSVPPAPGSLSVDVGSDAGKALGAPGRAVHGEGGEHRGNRPVGTEARRGRRACGRRCGLARRASVRKRARRRSDAPAPFRQWRPDQPYAQPIVGKRSACRSRRAVRKDKRRRARLPRDWPRPAASPSAAPRLIGPAEAGPHEGLLSGQSKPPPRVCCVSGPAEAGPYVGDRASESRVGPAEAGPYGLMACRAG